MYHDRGRSLLTPVDLHSRDTTDLRSDELVLKRLSALLQEVDPVPESVTAAARAAFRATGDASHSGADAAAGDPHVGNEQDLVVNDTCSLAERGVAGDLCAVREPELVRDAGHLRLTELLGPPS
jgi:hypothetical protein